MISAPAANTLMERSHGARRGPTTAPMWFVRCDAEQPPQLHTLATCCFCCCPSLALAPALLRRRSPLPPQPLPPLARRSPLLTTQSVARIAA